MCLNSGDEAASFLEPVRIISSLSCLVLILPHQVLDVDSLEKIRFLKLSRVAPSFLEVFLPKFPVG